MIQKRSGVRRYREPLTRREGSNAAFDQACTRSLKGQGPNQLPPTYGKTRFNGFQEKEARP